MILAEFIRQSKFLPLCGLLTTDNDSSSLFGDNTHKLELIIIKTCHHLVADENSIQLKICKLMIDGIIEPSTSLAVGNHQRTAQTTNGDRLQ